MKIVRLMPVYDEDDVLPYNLEWYAQAGLPTVVLVDEHPESRCRRICEQARADGTVIALDSIETGGFEWERKVYARLTELVKEVEAEAFVLAEPDEFFEVADGSPLREALERDFEAGYNLIKFFNMEFAMTRLDDLRDPNPLTRMRHYSLKDVEKDRAFPRLDGIDLLPMLGHRPTFPDPVEDRRSPRRYISRHYPLRTVEQAQRKIRRVQPPEATPGISTHYLRFSGEPAEFFVDRSHLTYYGEDHDWSYEETFLPQRLRHTAWALSHARIRERRLREEIDRLRQENAALRRRAPDVGEPPADNA